MTKTLDYLPFGEDLGTFYPQAAGGNSVKFTSKERDAETGLDYFGARYMSAAQGRFTSPDWSAMPEPIPYADRTNPQTLNLYAYVRNTPLTLTDADGHDLDCSGDKARLAGCQAILKWYADHNIDPYRQATAARVTKPGSEVTYSYDDGSMIKLVGTRNFRDNNAGNAIADPAKLGKDGPFVILPAAWDGINAVAQRLQDNSDQTLLERIKIQTPEDDHKTSLLKGNNPVLYANRLAAAAGPGVSAATKIKDLTPDQFSRVVRALLSEEGYFSTVNRAVASQK